MARTRQVMVEGTRQSGRVRQEGRGRAGKTGKVHGERSLVVDRVELRTIEEKTRYRIWG